MQALGSPVDRISILAKGACDALYDIRLRSPTELGSIGLQPGTGTSTGIKSWLGKFYDANIGWLKFRIAISSVEMAFGRRGLFWGLLWLQKLWHGLTDTLKLPGGHKSQLVEQPPGEKGDLMQEQVIAMAKDFGVEIDEKIFRG